MNTSGKAPTPDQDSNTRWIAVAHLLRPQGRRGELLADPLTDLPDVFTAGRSLRLAASLQDASTAPAFLLEDCWRPQGRNAGRIVLKLAGIDSISAAEDLLSKDLFLPEDQLPALDLDTYLVRDLTGCLLLDGENPVGTVSGLQFPVAPDGRTRLPDTADLLVVQPQTAPPDADPLLIPFVKAWVDHIDVHAKRITMHLPPGLLDDADSEAAPAPSGDPLT